MLKSDEKNKKNGSNTEMREAYFLYRKMFLRISVLEEVFKKVLTIKNDEKKRMHCVNFLMSDKVC